MYTHHKHKKPKFFLRIFIYFLILTIFIILILFKKNQILKNRNKDVVTFINQWEKYGKPVYVKKLKPENLDIIEKITGTSNDGININSYINLNLKSDLRVNQKFFIEIKDEKDSMKTKNIYGYIRNISNYVDYKTGMYVINLKLKDKLENIKKEDTFFTCYIIKKQLNNIILLPNESIKKDQKGLYVFTVFNNKTVKKYVEVGYNNGLNQVITKGLNFNDIVIIEGLSILNENDQVDIIKEI
jgi:hypothetical protein